MSPDPLDFTSNQKAAKHCTKSSFADFLVDQKITELDSEIESLTFQLEKLIEQFDKAFKKS